MEGGKEKESLNSTARQLNARKNSRYCPHCKSVVANSTFYKHSKRYKTISGQWIVQDLELPVQDNSGQRSPKVKDLDLPVQDNSGQRSPKVKDLDLPVQDNSGQRSSEIQDFELQVQDHSGQRSPKRQKISHEVSGIKNIII